jgi:hypothetical protein
MSFEREYEEFIEKHRQASTGERLRRLTPKEENDPDGKNGHGYGEKIFLENVWFPVFGHFEHLHPEYEYRDFEDRHRYLDYAYLRPPFRIAIEADGYGTHFRDVSRWGFSDNLFRQNYLMIDGWFIFRFSVDEVRDRPSRCRQAVRHFVGHLS